MRNVSLKRSQYVFYHRQDDLPSFQFLCPAEWGRRHSRTTTPNCCRHSDALERMKIFLFFLHMFNFILCKHNTQLYFLFYYIVISHLLYHRDLCSSLFMFVCNWASGEKKRKMDMTMNVQLRDGPHGESPMPHTAPHHKWRTNTDPPICFSISLFCHLQVLLSLLDTKSRAEWNTDLVHTCLYF